MFLSWRPQSRRNFLHNNSWIGIVVEVTLFHGWGERKVFSHNNLLSSMRIECKRIYGNENMVCTSISDCEYYSSLAKLVSELTINRGVEIMQVKVVAGNLKISIPLLFSMLSSSLLFKAICNSWVTSSDHHTNYIHLSGNYPQPLTSTSSHWVENLQKTLFMDYILQA